MPRSTILKARFLKASLATSSILLAIPQVYASDVNQGESIALDSISRALILSNDSKDAEFSEKGIAKEAQKTIGIQAVTSDNVDVYTIPLGYGLPISLLGGEEYINFSADIPYINIESTAGDESGMGDIKFGAEYFIEKNRAIFKAAFDLKLPTGEEDDGLGTGSMDMGFSISARKRDGRLGYTGTAGYTLTGEGEPNNFKRDYGDVITLVGGFEYSLKPAFWAGANLAYVRTGETEFDVGGNAPGLQTLDLVPNASFRIDSEKTLTAEMIIPVQDSYVGTSTGLPDPDREMSFSFGFTSEF
jgi:hypothetical protein